MFEAPSFIAESLEQPKIKAGGSSSSNLLNRMFDTTTADLGLLLARTNALALRADRIESAATSQSAGLLAMYQSLSTRVDQASGYTKILCDMHSQTYVDTATTTADLNYEFGQATLPVRSRTDLLVQSDVYGTAMLSPETETSYAIESFPDTLDFVPDPDGLNMLRGEQAWVFPEQPSGTICWIKIKAPLQYRGLTPNVLEIWPLPAFTCDLLSVSYQLAGRSFSSTWTNLDLTYLPMYSVASSLIPLYGPVRLHLPNLPLSQIRIRVRPRPNTSCWGFSRIKLYHVEYEESGTLTVKDPYSRTVSQPLLQGKDSSTLSTLSSSLNNNKATITLTTTDTSTTPVITGCILNV